jgi:hypothetical protein
MPACVHKILVLGADIVSGAILPLVQLSEEAQESRNKDRKYFRRSYSRKISRSSMNEEIFSLLLVSSDPLTSSLRKLLKETTKTYLPKELKLFAVPKESEDLICSDPTVTEGDPEGTSEEISN